MRFVIVSLVQSYVICINSNLTPKEIEGTQKPRSSFRNQDRAHSQIAIFAVIVTAFSLPEIPVFSNPKLRGKTNGNYYERGARN